MKVRTNQNTALGWNSSDGSAPMHFNERDGQTQSIAAGEAACERTRNLRSVTHKSDVAGAAANGARPGAPVHLNTKICLNHDLCLAKN